MKTIITCIIVLFTIAPAMAQVTDITQINPQLTERPWLDNSVHDIYGHRIIKVFGERPSPQRHSNLGVMTTMAYLDPEQTLEKYGKDSPGGCVEVFITRDTESRANFKWFFVVVRGEDDKEKVMEIDLDYQASQLPEGNGWWNFTTVFFPEKVEVPFFVYLNDRQSTHLSDFKFRVEK